MVQILFTVYDGRTNTGYRHVTKTCDTLEQCKDYMHSRHNRCTSYYHWIIDGKCYAGYDKIGVIH